MHASLHQSRNRPGQAARPARGRQPAAPGQPAAYQFDAIYDSGQCGYQSNGTYQVRGNSIYFQPQDESAFSVIYSFNDGTLVLCDVPDTAECNHYNQPVQ